MTFIELNNGIDSLYVSFKGILKDDIKTQLEKKKLQAQSGDERERALAKMIVEDHCFEVKDKGKGFYAYVLADAWYHIQVSSSEGKTLPPVYVQISSEVLFRIGIDNSMNQLRNVINTLFIRLDSETISRADLFVDFMTDVNLESIREIEWIRRAKRLDKYWMEKTFTGWSIGLGGGISARLYNKTKEIETSHKEYIKSAWELKGWCEGQTVWRLEFELKRILLKQMSVNTLSDLMVLCNDIWRYCTHDWLRLAIEENTVNRNRWDTHPLWNMLQQVKHQPGDYSGIMRSISKGNIPNERSLFLNGLGYLTDFAAFKGFDTIDELTVLGFLFDLRIYLESYIKQIGTYKNYKEYLEAKINLKKRKYNKA